MNSAAHMRRLVERTTDTEALRCKGYERSAEGRCQFVNEIPVDTRREKTTSIVAIERR